MKTNAGKESPEFRIKSSFQGFADRQKSVFDQLNTVELDSRNSLLSNTPPSFSTHEVEEDPPPRSNTRMRQFQGKESIFKKPQLRPPARLLNRRTPDYQINPHKWTRYSLDDVKSEDMSDRANTTAALSFLKELEDRKKTDSMDVDESSATQKIVFKKSSRPIPQEGAQSEVSFSKSKVIMPEYVVGQKIKKERRKQEKKVASSKKEIKLDHLRDDDEDD